jgi:putative transcriptional regulator
MTATHETMESLHVVGAIDERTMRRLDEACLAPIKSEPKGSGPS